MISHENTRLYISPLSPDIYPLIISSSSTIPTENVSYHSLQTFPESNYGFLDLPRLEADKMRKKLNGSILKGKKLRVEEARPRKRTRLEVDDDLKATEHRVDQERSDPQPSSAPADLAGHELPADRKIKRGWTEPKRKDKKRKASAGSIEVPPSKYSEQAECLFRTQLPPNRTVAEDKTSSKKSSPPKDSRKTVVHEFEKATTHPTFLREQDIASQDSTAASFVEGKGWVDQSGKLIEKDPKLTSRGVDRLKSNTLSTQLKRSPRTSKDEQVSDITTATTDEEHRKDSITKNSRAVSGPASTNIFGVAQASSTLRPAGYADDTSSEGSSSDTDSDEETSSHSDTSATPTARSASTTAEVHPLEALFKRNKNRPSESVNKPSLEIKTSFNFFEPEADEAIETTVPATPFTRKDMLLRGQRSAAPTPDTAAPTKATFSRSEIDPKNASTSNRLVGKEDDEDLSVDHREPKSAVSEGGKEESNFTKWFWENRGDNNRNWKRLRREAAKEKRQKENRRSRLGRG